MHNLILAILCSVAVSVLLKIARKKNIIIEQAIAFNYITAITFSYFLLKPDFKGLEFTDYIVQSENSPIFFFFGLGQYFVTSIYNRDYTVILGVTVFYSTLIVVLNIIVDMIYPIIDPRVTTEKERA